MARSTLAFFSWILAAGALVAQTRLVLPGGAAQVEATGSTNVPFGRSTAMLVQAAYDARLFPAAVTIQALAMRLDGGTTATAKTVELELRASTMAADILGIQADFATNRGSDERSVLTRKILSLPTLAQGATPNPFLVSFPFDTPFPYTPAANAWLVEFRVYGQQPGSYTLDSSWVCDSPTRYFGPQGCGPQGGPVLTAACETLQVMWGRSFFLSVRDAKPVAATLLMLGTFETGSWAGIPIPYDLTSIGAPGCSLSLDPVYIAAKNADATGLASYGFSLPSYPWFLGQTIRFQGAALDAAANPLGLVSSQPGKVVVCGWELVARTWATVLTATSGTREVGVAPIVELTVQ